ncbi:MAG: DUF2975 domain-containing protein [Eubacteriales bacterium]|nr:DUF2975 domain-containing protein [Eubacteriales bacterium]
MKDNDFRTDTNNVIKKNFSEKVGSLLMIATFLTGIGSIGGVWSMISMIKDGSWSEIGINAFAWRSLMFLCMFCAFIALVKIAIDEKPFSKTLSVCLWIIGGLIIAASIVFPRLSGYRSSGFELFSGKNFVLIDGMILVVGILFIILGSLIKDGFEMQKEMEEIL